MHLICVIHLTDVFTEEEKKSFEDPAYYKVFRRELETDLNVRSHFAVSSTCARY